MARLPWQFNMFRCDACGHKHAVSQIAVDSGQASLMCPQCKKLGYFTWVQPPEDQETETQERLRDHWRDDDSPFGEFISSSSPEVVSG